MTRNECDDTIFCSTFIRSRAYYSLLEFKQSDITYCALVFMHR